MRYLDISQISSSQAGGGTRTHGLILTRDLLYQLSYSGARRNGRRDSVVCFGHGLAEANGKLRKVEHPKKIGDRSTLAIMLALHDVGFAVLLPFGENTRYDLAIDDGVELRKVQCKTGRLRNGAIRFAACSSYVHHRNPVMPRRSYTGEVDAFAVYCPDTNGVYLVPIHDLAVERQGALRVEAPRNNQRRFIRFASDYEVARVNLRRSQPAQANESSFGQAFGAASTAT